MKGAPDSFLAGETRRGGGRHRHSSAKALLVVTLAVAVYAVRKMPQWSAVQRVVSHLPVWVLATGASLALAAWACYVLPPEATRWVGRRVGLRGGIPPLYLVVISAASAPLGIYYLMYVASDSVSAVYISVFMLCLLTLMVRDVAGERRGTRRRKVR